MPYSPSPKLVEALDEAIEFLRSYREDFWADWLATDRERLQRGEVEA